MSRSHIYRSFLGIIWIRLQGMWPVGDARRGVNVGGIMFALQRARARVSVCLCAHSLVLVWFS